MEVTRRWLCPIDGMIDLPGETDRCPLCGVTALDPTDPANRDAIDEARQLHTSRNTKGWMIAALGLFILIGTGLVTWKLGAGALNVALYGFAFGGAGLMTLYASRRERQWRGIPGERGEQGRAVRRWTSTIVIAFVICLGFVPVTLHYGIDALAYARGRPAWQLVTSAFTHGGPIHFIGNMLGLVSFGMAVDLRVGRAATAVILAFAAVAAALAQAQYSAGPMVGFSGAIYGLLGAMLALMPTRRQLLTLQGVPIPMPMWAWLMIVLPLFTFIAWADQRSHVAWVAHLGGFAAGFLVALPMRRIAPSRWFLDAEARRAQRLERRAA